MTEKDGEKDIDLKRCDVCGVSCRQWVEGKLGSVYCSWSCVEKNEQEAKISKMIESQHESERNIYLKDENKELRTRVAELEKKVEEYEATKQTDRSFEALMNYQLKLNELQTRLSTLEAELEQKNDDDADTYESLFLKALANFRVLREMK